MGFYHSPARLSGGSQYLGRHWGGKADEWAAVDIWDRQYGSAGNGSADTRLAAALFQGGYLVMVGHEAIAREPCDGGGHTPYMDF